MTGGVKRVALWAAGFARYQSSRPGGSDWSLSRKAAPLYSDLTLHDMGPAGANLCSAARSRVSWRSLEMTSILYP